MEDKLRRASSDEQIRPLLRRVNFEFLKSHSKGEDPLLIPLKRLASQFHYHSKYSNLFVGTLREANVPVGEIERRAESGPQQLYRYYFIACQHKKRALDSLLNEPKLERFLQNPVIQVCGQKLKNLPSSTKLVNKIGFVSPNKIFSELGVIVGGKSKLKSTDFFIYDCPVPIFKYNKGYYFSTNQEDDLRAFLKKRLRQLNGIG